MEKYRGLNAVKDEHNNLEMTYDEVIDDINYFASALQKAGIKQKDFVSLFSENNGRHFICNQGVIKSGACSVLRGTSAAVDELDYILKHSDSKALVLSDYKILSKLANVINENNNLKFVTVIFPDGEKPSGINIPIYTFGEFIEMGKKNEFIKPEISLEDNVSILYTSGTTGFPKGVCCLIKTCCPKCCQLKTDWELR